MTARTQPTGKEWVAIALAIGLVVALNVFVLAVLYDAITNDENAGLSENATRVLTVWGSGIIGILGALFGYRAAEDHNARKRAEMDETATKRAERDETAPERTEPGA